MSRAAHNTLTSAPTSFDPFRVPIDAGISLVEASAGTGKTFGIVMMVLRLLLEENADGKPLLGGIGNILVVTFTNAATNELITRIRETLGLCLQVFTHTNTLENGLTAELVRLREQSSLRAVDRLREAVASVDKLSVFTIHGFCKRVLDEFALESGTPFNATLIEDSNEIVQGALDDWWRRTLYENASLAGFAVQRKWTPSEFRRDFERWRCLPGTRIEPCVAVNVAMDEVQAALTGFASVWNATEVAAYLDSLTWLSKSPLRDAHTRSNIIARGTAAAAGDLGAAADFAHYCTSEALQRKDSGAGKKGKEAARSYAEIPDQPFVRATNAVAVALESLQCALRASCLEATLEAMTREKTRRNVLGFDDLLLRLRDALVAEGSDGLLAQAIRRQYGAALIDEFQDTDPYQFPIFNTAFRGRPLFLIGDPKQSIYSFRGADIHAYLTAAAQAEHKYSLSKNWRSTSEMIGAVNALFGGRANAFFHRDIRFYPVEAANRELRVPFTDQGRRALHWYFVSPNDESATLKAQDKGKATTILMAACVDEIAHLLSVGVTLGRVAVLVRSGYEGRRMEELLRGSGIPAVVSGMGDILQSEEFRELQLILLAIATPRNNGIARAALATELWGATQSEILRLSSAESESLWDAVLVRMEDLRDVWQTSGCMVLFQLIMNERRVLERLLPYPDGDRRLTNLRHVFELIHAASLDQQLNIEGLLHWIAAARARPSEDRKVTELRLESDADAVQIVTIHSSKGLEFDVVFCPTLWSTRLATDDEPVVVHHGNDDVVFDHGSSERAQRGVLANAERLAEDLRLTYVALTRARFRTYLGWGPIKTSSKADASWFSAMAYLLFGTSVDDATSLEHALALASAGFQPTGIADWKPSLEALVAANADTMSMTVLGTRAETSAHAILPMAAAPTLRAREEVPARAQFESWSIASYTTLSSGASVESPRDLDDAGADRSVLPTTVVGRTEFGAFPAGRRPGIVLHELFERARFSADHAETREEVSRVLLRSHFAVDAADERIDAVTAMMQRVFASPVGRWPFALRDVSHARTLREWEFLLPLGAVSRYTFADLFKVHGGESGARYATLLRQLSMRSVHGFLTGFVDLVFEHEGRWYVADWKSNQLGGDALAYSQQALTDVMDANHYTLQSSLYLVALHRYLTHRVPGYTYETHMGGVAYAFLRGFTALGSGWYTDRPPFALVDALSALMDAGQAGNARGAA